MNQKLTLSGKLTRLRARLREPQWRRYGALLLTGKLTAIGLLMIAAIFLNPDLIGFRTFAADPALGRYLERAVRTGTYCSFSP